MSIPNIYIAGSGNVSWHLIRALKNANIHVSGVWSRNSLKLNELSQTLNIPIISENEFYAQNGLFFLCVNDSSIEKIASNFRSKSILIHCAGSLPLSILEKYSPNSGVFYPLQTLNKEIEVNFNEIPILLEFSNNEVKQILTTITEKLNCTYFYYSSEQRILVHIAAVLANNFSNLMFALAQDFLQKHQINPSILNPLITETASKAIKYGAYNSQTGPSVRNDSLTIEKHLTILKDLPELKNFYSFVSNYINMYYKEKN